MIRTRAATAAVIALSSHPELWLTALRQLFLLAPRGWWRRFPPLPLPDERYWRFRMETAYGNPEADPLPEDLIAYLQWCRRQPHMER